MLGRLHERKGGHVTDQMDSQKTRASDWFRSLRNQIVASFEALEDSHTDGPFADQPAGRFELSETKRTSTDGSDAGGGLMSVMRGGRVFEKVGVNISTVYGVLGDRAQGAMAARKGLAGMKEDPRFWASGISLVAHMQNPHCPAVHMNTRMFWTPHAWWFGGGSDLNPCLEYDADIAHFHKIQKDHCEKHDPRDLSAAQGLGRRVFLQSPTEAGRAVSAGFFWMITIPAIGTLILALFRMSGGRFYRPLRRWSKNAEPRHLARRKKTHNCSIAGSMPNTIWSTIGAPNLALRADMMPMLC